MSPFLLECAKQGKTGRFEVFRIDPGRPWLPAVPGHGASLNGGY
jgi:hypothetical protein